MGHLLRIWLILTGIGTLFVLSFPDAVTIGLIMLIIPGLILGSLPTVFLWSVVFGAWRWILRIVLKKYAGLIAIPLTIALMWFLPQPSAMLSQARLDRVLADKDVLPKRLSLTGDIRIAMPRSDFAADPPGTPYSKEWIERRPYICDALCAALLATPGVTSVTVTGLAKVDSDNVTPINAHARTYRVRPRGTCTNPVVPKIETGLQIDRPRKGRGFSTSEYYSSEAEWNLRLAARDCIDMAAPLRTHDLTVAHLKYRTPEREPGPENRFALGPQSVSIDRFLVTDRSGRVVLRRTVASTRALSQPLFVGWGGGMNNGYFEWNRARLANAPNYPDLNPHEILADRTSIHSKADAAAMRAAMVAQLAAALDDSALPATDSAFALTKPWFRSFDFHGATMTAAEKALMLRLVADPRVTELDGIYHATKAMGADSATLREPIAKRIASATLPVVPPETIIVDGVERRLNESEWPVRARILAERNAIAASMKTLAAQFESLPPGTFASQTPDEAAILGDVERRTYATGLIARQADRGAAAGPLLVEILRTHWTRLANPDREAWDDDDRDPVFAARTALCVLGPDAAAALRPIEGMLRDGTIKPNALDRDDWDFVLVRMGKPVSAMRKPENRSGTQSQYEKRLRDKLDRGKLDQSCSAQWLRPPEKPRAPRAPARP